MGSVKRTGAGPLLAACALAGVLVGCPAASAGPLWDWICGNDCPPPAYYSKARYWTPGLARIDDYCHGPKISVYAPDRHPEVPPNYAILPFGCPPVVPKDTFIPVPTAPPGSRFKYFERTDEDIKPTIPADEGGKAGKSDKDKADKDKTGKDKAGKDR